MVSSVSRNWVGGLSSGLDTEALIDQLLEAESTTKYSLEQKRNTLTLQQSMLQDVNLKLYNLQTAATDLTFSATFNSKTVSSTDSKLVTATATTAASVGEYNVSVKQVATTTSVSSYGTLAASLADGQNLTSSDSVGGSSTNLESLGITGGNLTVSVAGAGTVTLSGNVGSSTSIEDYINNINAGINNNSSLKGVINATYDESSNKIKFNLLSTSKSVSISDADGGNMLSSMFESDGSIDLSKSVPTVSSSLQDIKSGMSTTLDQLGFNIDPDTGLTVGTFTINRGGNTATLDISGYDPSTTTMGDLVEDLNSQIDTQSALVKDGTVTGNPDDRLVEFRFDDSTGKLQLLGTDYSDGTSFTATDDVSSSFFADMFGSSSVTSTYDAGDKLANENFATTITAGKFTIDGVQIEIDPSSDTLNDVLSRINAKTNLSAKYDPETDTISLTRKDGSTSAIGVGSSSDTSNFLSAVGLVSGSQASAAAVTGTEDLGMTLDESRTETLGDSFGSTGGTMKISVNGSATNIKYTADDTLESLLQKIQDVSGVESAYYDASTGKINIKSSDTGADASLEIEDVTGDMADQLGINVGKVSGLDTGSTLTSSRAISGINSSAALQNAGFASPITAGTFSINGVSFTVASTSTTTLDSLISAINSNEDVGVDASYDKNTGKLLLTSRTTGNQSIAIGDPSDTSNFLSAMGLTYAEQNVGQNAIFSINGGTEQISQSNDISDAIEGVTFKLRDVTTGIGETITIEADTETAKEKINTFLDLYNEVTELIYDKLTETRNFDLSALTDDEMDALDEDDLATYQSGFSEGLLAGNSTLRSIRSQMRNVMSSLVPGVDSLFDSLSDIGITTGTIGSSYTTTMVGTLSITDEDAFNDALKNNPNEVAELFKSSSGIATTLKATLNEYTKSDGLLTSLVGKTDSTITNEMSTQISDLNTRISEQEDRLAEREEALIAQFADLETAMSEYQSQSSSLTSQLSSLTGS